MKFLMNLFSLCFTSFLCFSLTVQKNEMPQLCTMCQTSHQMSDMVESKSDEGLLEFFCSNRCMTVHKASQSVAEPGMMVTCFCTA